MPDEAACKRMVVDYAERINAGDIEGVLDLFTDDVVFADPVGRPPMVGKGDLRRHLELAVECGTHEVPGPPVSSMDERFVAVYSTITVQRPKPMTFRVIGIVELDENGLGVKVDAYWGVTDVTIEEFATVTGPEGVRA
ncbi:nuclear transport factor 2 family protein [Streptomyces acidiscabies]|uniref:Nuclear transport factor 2 family protein n=1 Tax=Streptomyces acidiscabies TaxID=42234 RepID=A0AAP6EHL7_9ACTN|nr:nuclear transport factor 2 family protein [Streptomyces acidiscabies]MBZ3913274.1 nuclear transport factor 2 family protein [Streptomyces acidiscabies]MDX2963302.1 nuclear transport factor 2 family protein [Streptomyces acidiscabies]MDX3021481.1 nuclear transport factor 2 family protein [Streptomyces acidiscabies]MDX3790239.1 nuclear transport factor 2 family protein [Streptomyces acidiscabies]GAV45878.1 epoxide hydrolase LasB [Streptomyces acidiscabies]